MCVLSQFGTTLDPRTPALEIPLNAAQSNAKSLAVLVLAGQGNKAIFQKLKRGSKPFFLPPKKY